jgi:hypothetical protein
MAILPSFPTDRTPLISGVGREQTPPEHAVASRIYSIADPVFYRLYSFFNPVPWCPEFDPPSLFYYTDLAEPYEGVIRRNNEEREFYRRQGMREEILYPPGVIQQYLDNPIYADPVFRKSEARKYLESILARTLKSDTIAEKNKTFWTHVLCDVEIRELYENEYRAKFDEQVLEPKKKLFRLAGGILPEDLAAEHRATWNQMPPGERAKKICWGGKPIRYAAVALATSAVAGACFFLSRHGHCVLASPCSQY